jgi:hypothetical protein
VKSFRKDVKIKALFFTARYARYLSFTPLDGPVLVSTGTEGCCNLFAGNINITTEVTALPLMRTFRRGLRPALIERFVFPFPSLFLNLGRLPKDRGLF